MRGSDWIDLALDIAPRRVAALFLLLVLAMMWLTGSWAPLEWYIHDKAASVVEQLQTILQRSTDRMEYDMRARIAVREPAVADVLSPRAV